jgi:hypothetical protein
MGSHYVLLRKAAILFTVALRYWQFGLRARPNHTTIALHTTIVKIRLWAHVMGLASNPNENSFTVLCLL